LDAEKKEAIRRFLREFKQIATAGRGVDIVDRLKNMQSLAQLGLTKRNCFAVILGLSVEDYCDGPRPDKGRSGEIWEFGQVIGGEEVYIKLKIAQVGEVRLAKCLSFHIAEHPLCFPCREK
jgi:hypothetical protein